MEDITLIEFIWNISFKISEWICSIKLKEFLIFVFIFLGWKLIDYLIFERGVFYVKK